MPFLSNFHEKIDPLMPIFFQKPVYSLRNTLLSCIYIFFKLIIKDSLRSCAYLVKNMSILLKLYYNLGKKINRMPFLYDFLRRNYYCHAHVCQKNVHSIKSTFFARPYCQKNVNFHQNTMLSFQNFH